MSFDSATYSHLTDYTVGSYNSQLGYFNVIPSPSANQAVSTSIYSITRLDATLRLDVHLLSRYNHKPNNFASDWHKVIGHCLQPGGYMGFCNNQDQLQTWTTRMLAALETQLVSDSADYDVIAEIISLQMAKEIWHHIVLRPVASNPSVSIADIYWDQILDQQGDVSLEVVAFIFYEWCQKVLNVTLDRMAAANVILIYKCILRLKGPPLDKIQHVARDLGFISFCGRFFRKSLASDDEEAIDETSLDTEATNEDYDSYLDNSNDDVKPNGHGHQRRVASRKLRQLNQHPYAPPGGPIPPEDIINAQATSIQSTSFITSDALIATLATPHVESTASHLNVRVWVDNTVSYLKQQEGIQLGVCSIEAMIARCRLVSVHTTGSSFTAMITYMQLAMQCQSIITASEEHSNIRQFYNKEVAKLENAPSERTFHRWYEHGCKFILLAAGGSFYVLVIIAGLEIRWKVASMTFHVLRQVGNMLRQPGNGDKADLITRRIIPTIAWIRSQIPISLQKIFPSSFLTRVGAKNSLDCTDLELSDRVFDVFRQENFALPARDTVAWGIFKSDITEQMLVIGGKGINGLLKSLMHRPGGVKRFSVTVIRTLFDHMHGNNVRFPAENDRKENAIWTESECVKAAAGEVVRDLDDLSNKLDELYVEGYRNHNRYLRIPMHILNGGMLDLRNSNGSLMAFICPSLPETIRLCLTSSLLACFESNLVLQVRKFYDSEGVPQVEEDTSSTLEKLAEKTLLYPFQCLHFSLWNRYSTVGDNAPTHIHPHNMVRVDIGRTNHMQCLPYPSRDILEHQELYNNILTTFGKLFEWIEMVMKEFLPEEYEVLVELGQNLPGGE
ncbi:uncharacterized protein EDB91DRAFT_1248992 [Suillus paluster]|uniref:uncharacterized protein n=1 Tax=Suillus paluster TaxID=48578 RepID=UPI001B86478A|nr:uncharacterized protein EDB91DRAFT_1248992 [Suillus paluster]KAG1738831.1 hypothetical protein EDB91DRAFT_1248992 [Suillus paluster]